MPFRVKKRRQPRECFATNSCLRTWRQSALFPVTFPRRRDGAFVAFYSSRLRLLPRVLCPEAIVRFNADAMAVPDDPSEEVKTFKWTPQNAGVPEIRRRIAAAAAAGEVRVISLEESPAGRGWTKIEVTVAGHPSQVRAFNDELHGGASSSGSNLSDLVIDLATEVVFEPIWKAARDKWHKRREPPLRDPEARPGPGEARTTVSWTWERMLSDGDAVGPVRVDTYVAGQEEPSESEDWPQWVKRSEALAFAQEHGHVFAPQDLPDT
jgi:hypothetical protein